MISKKTLAILAGAGAVVLGGVAWTMKHPLHGRLTAARQMKYLEAMDTLKDPVALRILAAGYGEGGLSDQAKALSGRAALFEAAPDVKQARRKLFRDTMQLSDPNAVELVAVEFDKIYATGAADQLRRYAIGLRGGLPAGHNPSPPEFAGDASFGGRRKRRRERERREREARERQAREAAQAQGQGDGDGQRPPPPQPPAPASGGPVTSQVEDPQGLQDLDGSAEMAGEFPGESLRDSSGMGGEWTAEWDIEV